MIMIIQTRDRELLASLSRYGILSSEQIGELFFKGIRHTTVMKRLRMLEEENFILRAKGLPDSMSAWYLARLGAREINAPEPCRYTNQNIIVHEVNLSAVRIVLESIGIGEDFTSESELRRQYQWNRNDASNATRLIPDGIFVAPKNGKPYVVALELEIQPKNHARLRKIFTEYTNKSSIHRVFYVARTVSIANLVLREWSKCRHYETSPNLFVCLLDELKSDREKVVVYDSMGIKTPLHLIFDCKIPREQTAEQGSHRATHPLSNFAEESLSRQAS
jgi:hypothetical protein